MAAAICRAGVTIYSPLLALHNDFRLAIERIRADCSLGAWGTAMDTFETVFLSLLIVWAPGIALAAYLLAPRRTGMD